MFDRGLHHFRFVTPTASNTNVDECGRGGSRSSRGRESRRAVRLIWHEGSVSFTPFFASTGWSNEANGSCKKVPFV